MVDEYAKHGRLVDAGTIEQAEQQAARVWLADTLAGRDALLIVGTNAAAARVSHQLRAELVRLGRVAEAGVPLGMPGWEGTVAGVGDLVQARRNAWHLDGWAGNTEAPINRQTYRVTATRPDGGLTVTRVTGRDDGGTEQLALAVVADSLAGRTDRWLDQLAATGALPAHHRVAVAADEARTSLDQLLRTVELAGHDPGHGPARVLADAVTAGSLDKATSQRDHRARRHAAPPAGCPRPTAA